MKQDSQTLVSAIKTSISDVLETMFFLPVDFSTLLPEESHFVFPEDEVITVRLAFEGPWNGHGVFYIPRTVAASISADFMGMAVGSIAPEKIDETVLEMTNMVVGNALNGYDRKAVFNLKIPEIVESDVLLQEEICSDNQRMIIIDTLENQLAFKMVIYDKEEHQGSYC